MPSSSWTAPPSFAANDTLTAANMTILADDLKFLKNPDRARVYMTSAQTVANASWEAVSWDAEDYDTGGLWTSGSASRFTAAVDGWYCVKGQVQWEQSGTGFRRLTIRKNDTTSDATGGSQWARSDQQPNGSDDTFMQIVCDLYLSATDHVRMFAYQSSGGGLDIKTGSGSVWMSITWLGD